MTLGSKDLKNKFSDEATALNMLEKAVRAQNFVLSPNH